MRALFPSHLGEPPPALLIADDPPTGVLIALVPALDADGAHVFAPKSVWTTLNARDDAAYKPLNPLPSLIECTVNGDGPAALNRPGAPDLCAHEPGPAGFATVRGSCHVNAVPDGAMSLSPWLCSLLLMSLSSSVA